MLYVPLLMLLVNLLFSNVASVLVSTEQGKLRGELLQTVTGDSQYYSFKGIPYAKPPIGELRFTAPQSPEPWSGIRNATQHGSVCTQLNALNDGALTGSEDCLYLNVYTPDVQPSHPLPVMFFIPGGGFEWGSGNMDVYGPDYLISENVVIVTINYRVSVLGFLSLDTREVPGNAGLKDQVAAMRWVQKNIANFGGDPNQVTVFGESAGSDCVSLHNLSPMTAGLFRRSVSMSGVPLNDWGQPFQPRRLAFRLGQQLGLWTRDVQQLLKYLRSLPAPKLLGTYPAVLRSQESNMILKQLIYVPVVETDFGDEHFLTISPVLALEQGKINNIDVMIGHTKSEGLFNFKLIGPFVPELYANYSEMVVPRQILEHIPPKNQFALADKIHDKYFGQKQIDNRVIKEFVQFNTDIGFVYGISKYAGLISKYRKTFMYQFSKVTNFTRVIKIDNPFGLNGASHFDDVQYLFYAHDFNVTVNKDSDDYKVVRTTCALYTNFAKYGNPTPDNSLGVKWPNYDSVSRNYLDIDTNLTVGQHLNADVISFWDSIYEAAGLGF